MAAHLKSFATTGRSRKGEPWVWLTAAGLSIGVTLVVGLLLLVLMKGTGSFWPRQLVQIESTRAGEAVTTAGFIVQERERRDAEGVRHEEIQVFRGNRELNGDTFVFIDRAEIRSTSQPADLWLIERLEGGNVIGRPGDIVLHDGQRISASAGDFRQRLEGLLQQGGETRKELRKVERGEIGKINKELEALRIREKVDGAGPAVDTARADLQARYETLAAEARELREKLERDKWTVTAADGRTLDLPTGELIHIFEPNVTGFFGRVGEMFRRAWNFLTEDPREANTQGGVFPAIFGTVVMTLVMSLFVTPFGVIAAIYLREYAKQGPLVRAGRGRAAGGEERHRDLGEDHAQPILPVEARRTDVLEHQQERCGLSPRGGQHMAHEGAVALPGQVMRLADLPLDPQEDRLHQRLARREQAVE